MRRQKPFFNTILGVVIAAGCAEVTSAPEPQDAAIQTKRVSELLPGNCPAPAKVNVTAAIGRNGGVITIGPNRLEIPRGALQNTVTITAKTGDKNVGNAIKFGPEGLRFRTYAVLTMSMSNCNGWGFLQLPQIVYTDELMHVLELQPSIPDLWAKNVTAYITHFSRYAVAY